MQITIPYSKTEKQCLTEFTCKGFMFSTMLRSLDLNLPFLSHGVYSLRCDKKVKHDKWCWQAIQYERRAMLQGEVAGIVKVHLLLRGRQKAHKDTYAICQGIVWLT